MLRPSVVEAALAEGVTFFDTADVYGSGRSEEILGELLADRRDQVMVATKFGMDMGDGRGPRGSCDYITRAVEGPLRRLRTEVIDF
jgi:aryl-alcohol dehydrogenase-like predicted oxidoreductase